MVEGEYIGETAAQIPVISAAWRFLVPFYEDKKNSFSPAGGVDGAKAR